MSDTHKDLIPKDFKRIYSEITLKEPLFNPHNEILRMVQLGMLRDTPLRTRAFKQAHINMQISVEIVADLIQDRKNNWSKYNG